MICYLIRHGKDDNSVRGGWSDTPLTEQGITEVEALADALASDPSMYITELFSSDLKRAKQTAEIIASKLDLKIHYLPQFREVNNGVLAGMKNDAAKEKYPNLFWNTLDWNERYPNGESPCQFFERVSFAWKQFKEMARDKGSNIALITHGGVINVIYHIEHGLPYSNKNKPFSVKPAEVIPFEF